jgi:hypothetical protein
MRHMVLLASAKNRKQRCAACQLHTMHRVHCIAYGMISTKASGLTSIATTMNNAMLVPAYNRPPMIVGVGQVPTVLKVV